MFFWYPYKFDLPLSRIPKATYFISIICIIVFIAQTVNEHYFEKGLNKFCSSYADQEFTKFITSFKNAGDKQEECYRTIYAFHYTQMNDETIWKMINGITWGDRTNTEEARNKAYEIYRKAYDASKEYVPINITSSFGYRSGSFNPFTSISSDFLHIDIWHIAGNLMFFIAFGSVVELIISSYLLYTIIFILSSLTISLTWSLSSLFTPLHWSIGLSGVVSVMMGMAVYVVPTGRIRCAYLLGLTAGTVSVPLYWLFIWFLGWETYYVWIADNTVINSIAHVTGMIFGYLCAKKLYSEEKEQFKKEMDNAYTKIRLSKIERTGVLESIRKRNF